MPATLSTVSRRLFRMSRSVLKPHLSLNRKPKAVCEEIGWQRVAEGPEDRKLGEQTQEGWTREDKSGGEDRKIKKKSERGGKKD